MRKLFYLYVISIFLFFAASCTTMSDYDFSSVDNNIACGNYYAAIDGIEKSHESYGDKAEVLRNLDLALMNHYAGFYEASNVYFETAENLIRTYYAKSISQNIGAFLLNDLVMDYEGESFEDIYTNIFMALNYLAKNDRSNAFVEIRKFDEKLKLLSMKYAKQLAETEKELGGNVPKKNLDFHDSALARYLSMLLYRSDGDKGNANVDFQYISKAFANQSSLYDFPVPETITYENEVAVSPKTARLNVLAFSGLSPVKKEKEIRISWRDKYYKIAMPYMTVRPSCVTSILLSAKNLATGRVEYCNFELLENLNAISSSTFEAKSGLIYGRALLRSISKTGTQAGLGAASRNTKGTASSILALTQLFASVATEVTERADTRCCRYFPGKASVAALTLESGEYEINTTFFSGSRIVHYNTVKKNIEAGKLNFVEEFCLK